MKKSEQIEVLAKALCKFQSEISGAKKGSENPFFHSKYANLEEVISCAKEALMNNGLSVSQFPISNDRQAGVETILMHESGQWISGKCLLACSKVDPQGMGSAITYARRYSYQSILGIPSEDDDGNSASKPEPAAPAKKKKSAPISAEDKKKKSDPGNVAVNDELAWIEAMGMALDIEALKNLFVRCSKMNEVTDAITEAKNSRKEQLEQGNK